MVALALFLLLQTVLFSCQRTVESFSVTQLYSTHQLFTEQSQSTRQSTSRLFLSERVPSEDAALEKSTDTTPAPAPSSSSFPVGDAILRLGGDATTSPAAPTVWTEFSRLATEYPVVANLGQGFPDWPPPRFATDALLAASLEPATHQYTRPAGHPKLVEQLARRYTMHLQQQPNESDSIVIDPLQNVAVTVGASQALFLALQCVIQAGDEVVLMEPFFDLYQNQVFLAGGVPVYVPLEFQPYSDDETRDGGGGGTWVLHEETLRSKVTSKTKAILLNSPHNPTGKLFTRNEMEMIAKAVLELANPDCVVLSDEVYKYIVHAPPIDDDDDTSSTVPGHIHFASLPGMWDRTLTISSAGKTFSATGWQVGWCIGPHKYIAHIQRLLPYVQFCASTVVQEALARALVAADEPYHGFPSYYAYLRDNYTVKRNGLASALSSAGLAVPDWDRTPGGGFFILARVSSELQAKAMESQAQRGGLDRRPDWAVCEWLLQEHGLVCIPSSPFFSEESVEQGASDSFIRIAFCKRDVTLAAAEKALAGLKDSLDVTSIEEETETQTLDEPQKKPVAVVSAEV